MNLGYLHIPDNKWWAPYLYQNGELTIYISNRLNADDIQAIPNLDIQCKQKYLVGTDTTTIVFFVDSIPGSKPWTSSTCKVYYYFTLDESNNMFNGISFHCKELDCFYDSFQAFNVDIGKNNNVSFTAKSDEVRIKSFSFKYEDIIVNGTVDVSNSLSFRSPAPLEVKTSLYLSFPETNNFEFIMNLYTVAFKFICFISQRQNVHFDKLSLHQKCSILSTGEEYTANIPLNMENDIVIVEDTKEFEKTLPYSLIDNHLSAIWQFISDNKLYVEHLPESSASGRHYTIARMILIMAAFEWNANNFLNASQVKSQRAVVKNEILATLN